MSGGGPGSRIDEFLLEPAADARLIRKEQRLAGRWRSDAEILWARPAMNPDSLNRWQLEKIRSIVDNAVRFAPFYQRKYGAAGYRVGDLCTWADYEALPTLTKDELLDAESGLRHRLSDWGEHVHEARTSGSSGRILAAFQDDSANDQHLLNYERFYRQCLGPNAASPATVYQIYLVPERTRMIGSDLHIRCVSMKADIDVVHSDIRTVKPHLL